MSPWSTSRATPSPGSSPCPSRRPSTAPSITGSGGGSRRCSPTSRPGASGWRTASSVTRSGSRACSWSWRWRCTGRCPPACGRPRVSPCRPKKSPGATGAEGGPWPDLPRQAWPAPHPTPPAVPRPASAALERLAELMGGKLEPGPDLAGLVDLQVVDDQHHLPAGVPDQPPQEVEEEVGVQGALVQHEAHQPAVAHRRDQAPGHPLRRPRHHRGPAPGRPGTADLVLVGEAGLVAPVDHGLRRPGPPGDRRVVPLQPGRDRRGPALPGPHERLPRRHPPAPRVERHRRQAEPLRQAPLEQLADRARGPERGRQPRPVGRPLGDPAPDLPGLLRRPQALAAPRRHPPAVEEAVLAPLAVALVPDVDRPAVHPDRPRGFGLGHPLALDQEQGPPPQRLLRRPAEAAKVSCVHGPDMVARPPDVRYILRRLVASDKSARPITGPGCRTPEPSPARPRSTPWWRGSRRPSSGCSRTACPAPRPPSSRRSPADTTARM